MLHAACCNARLADLALIWRPSRARVWSGLEAGNNRSSIGQPITLLGVDLQCAADSESHSVASSQAHDYVAGYGLGSCEFQLRSKRAVIGPLRVTEE